MMYAIHKREDVSLCYSWYYGNALCAQSGVLLLQTDFSLGLFIKLQMAFSILCILPTAELELDSK